jgi:hypothetical protein
MDRQQPMPPELAGLWQDFLDGGLDAQQAAALERLLAGDPAAAALAGERYVEHRLIALALQREPADRFAQATLARIADAGQDFSRRVQQRLTSSTTAAAPPRDHRQVLRTPLRLLSAAAILLAVLLGALLAAQQRAPMAAPARPAPAAENPVATVIMAERCVWRGRQVEPGQRLAAGALELESGTALVRFDGGAEALLTGAVRMRLESAGSAACLRGALTIRAAAPATGFILRTPVAEVTDLGTEFAVSVDQRGVTEVQVLEGAVAWRCQDTAAADPGTRLERGQARRVRTPDDRAGEERPVTALSIAEQLHSAELHSAEREAAPSPPRASAEPAGLLSYEGFAYPFTATTSNRQDAAGGSGWRSPWFRNQLPNDLRIDLPAVGLAMPDGLAPAQGGALELPTEPERQDSYRFACMRLFAAPIALDVAGVRYASLLVRRSPIAAGPTHHWFRCMLTSETVPRDRLGFGIRSDGFPELLDRFGNSQAAVPIVDGETYLFVFKLVTGAAGDQSFLQVYGRHDPVDAYEPARWTITGVLAHDEGVLGSLHINNGTERGYTVDEIRIGTTWRSVTPRAGDQERP